MSPGGGGTLASVDGGGISQAEAVGPNFFTSEADSSPVVGAKDERTAVGSTVSTVARSEVTRVPAAPGARATTRSPAR